MTCLVHHLGGRVVLRIDVRHRLDDLGRADEGALLAVEELAELPGDHVTPDIALLLVGELVPHRGPEDGYQLVGNLEWVLQIGIVGPVDALVGVPLLPLALVVEVDELVATVVVVPGELARSRFDRRSATPSCPPAAGRSSCSPWPPRIIDPRPKSERSAPTLSIGCRTPPRPSSRCHPAVIRRSSSRDLADGRGDSRRRRHHRGLQGGRRSRSARTVRRPAAPVRRAPRTAPR